MKVIPKTISHTFIILILFIAGFTCKGIGQTTPPYEDKAHYSKVFGTEKPYRIYLPDSYASSNKKYPVIYFFHGWGGRHFKDDNAKLEYEKLGELVDKNQFIMVMWDGNMELSEPRPYNIGYHDNIKYDVQMKDYLPELVSFIDTTYRTYTDRSHRGIIGFSMGGILSFYLSGKYPDRFSAAVNMVGSPEFFIGRPDNHTLYQVRYTFDNLQDVSLLFHNRDSCQMSGLNDEVNNGALWSQVKDYEYNKMKGGHKVDDPGETKVFESAVQFIISRFENPVPLNKTWSHYDLYPDFSLWDYSVKSNKAEPGYLYLRNVDKNGFGFYTIQWLPDGPELKNCKATVSTAPIYEPNVDYRISCYSKSDRKLTMMHKPADKDGRLHFELPGSGTEIGIAKADQQAGYAVLDYSLNGNRRFIRINEDNELTLNILNRDGAFARKGTLKVTLSCADSSVILPSPVQAIDLAKGKYLVQTDPFKVFSTKTPPSDGSPWQLRIKVGMEYDTVHLEDDIVVPVFYNVHYFANVKVDDGRLIPSVKITANTGMTAKDSIYGTGNGDGKVAPGEQIMLYKDGHRLRLYSDDPYVVAEEEKMVDEVLPAVWPDGYTLSSVVKIAPDCPAGHEIEFIGHYETKTYMPIYRQVKWGKIKVKVVP
ncbi:MAG TPA: alpha/beta fold hydrolase [Prolixibacteraceae bacterium]|nr:alpha/beta fold hydrolase [Prolixibacteraceae bacterium]